MNGTKTFRAPAIGFWLASAILLGGLVRFEGRAEAAETPAIVYAERVFDRTPERDERTHAIERATSGRLLVRESDGSLRVLVDGASPAHGVETPIDVSDPDVSFDGERIVFSGFSPSDGAWRIYEVSAAGTGLRKLTHSDRLLDLSRYGELAPRFEGYDDVDPCCLPDGRVCFVSTRYPGLAPSGRLRATNLYIVEPDGTDLHRVTSERFGADTPAIDPLSGKIVYSRWWLSSGERDPANPGGDNPRTGSEGYGPVTPFGNFSELVLRRIRADEQVPRLNHWVLASIRPDGGELAMLAGAGLNREATMAYRPAFFPDGRILAQFILDSPMLGFPSQNGLRLHERGAGSPDHLGGPQDFHGTTEFSDFIYSSAVPLPDGRILVTGVPVSSRFRPRVGPASPDPAAIDIYLQDLPDGAPQRLGGHGERADLDAVPLTSRPLPPEIEDRAGDTGGEWSARTVEEAFERGGSFRFVAENIFRNAPVDVDIAHAPPIHRDLVIEFFMNPQRSGVENPEPPVLIERRPIGPDGRVEVELPGGVPLFEVLRTPDESVALGRDGQAFHVNSMNWGVAGADARCVGCHTGHSMMDLPEKREELAWTNVAPSAVVTASSVREIDVRRVFVRMARPVSLLLVDRQTDARISEWGAREDDPEPHVRLRWRRPILAREVVIYGAHEVSGERESEERGEQTVGGADLEFYLGDTLAGVANLRAVIEPGGTRVAVDPAREFDRLEVKIPVALVEGSLEGSAGPTLSEIEVIGRAIEGRAGTLRIVRGDANCDRRVNASDAIAILEGLFKGRGPLCCEEAADANVDTALNMTDAIHLLGWLFLGATPPAGPWPFCGAVSEGSLSCDQEDCP